jgi:hypothetical protein
MVKEVSVKILLYRFIAYNNNASLYISYSISIYENTYYCANIHIFNDKLQSFSKKMRITAIFKVTL